MRRTRWNKNPAPTPPPVDWNHVVRGMLLILDDDLSALAEEYAVEPDAPLIRDLLDQNAPPKAYAQARQRLSKQLRQVGFPEATLISAYVAVFSAARFFLRGDHVTALDFLMYAQRARGAFEGQVHREP